MRIVDKEEFVSVLEKLIFQAQYYLPEDVLQAIKYSIKTETNILAKEILLKILENAEVASITHLPLCQDTGIPQVFIEIGQNVTFDFDLVYVLGETITKIYNEEKLRISCVSDPLLRKENIHCYSLYMQPNSAYNEQCKISVLIRGGGSENMSSTKLFLPTTTTQEICDYIVETTKQMLPFSCPPVVVGIGIGGTVEQSIILAKKSLLRLIGERNTDIYYSKLEQSLKEKINETKIGPLSLGGDTTVLDVFIETAPTHIATLPVSVVLQCHSFRRYSIVL